MSFFYIFRITMYFCTFTGQQCICIHFFNNYAVGIFFSVSEFRIVLYIISRFPVPTDIVHLPICSSVHESEQFILA